MQLATSISTGITLCSLAILASAAAARFEDTPVTTDHGTTLAVRGVLTDLPGRDIQVRLSASGVAAVSCYNPNGKRVPGQRSTSRVTLNGTQNLPASDVVNGRVSFDVATDPLVTTGKHLCPNETWTAQVEDVQFQTVTIRVVQDGKVVVTQTWNP